MEAYRNTIVFGCVATYMVLCIIIGLWAMRKTKNAHDFFMAGRNLGVLVTGIAVFSSTLSGFGFVGGPALIASICIYFSISLLSKPPVLDREVEAIMDV